MQDFKFDGKKSRFDIRRYIFIAVFVVAVIGIVFFVMSKISKKDDSAENNSDKIISAASSESEDNKTSSNDAKMEEPKSTDTSEKSDAKVTDKPKASDKPEATDKPKATGKPEATDEPKATDKSEATDKPKATDKVNESDVIVPESEAVGDDYFDDALFIGDSRVEGLQLLSGISNGTFYVEKGLNVKKIINNDIANVDGKKMTVYEALGKKKFGKIYIKSGINELGWIYPKVFIKEYTEIIEKIKELQPDATIYVQSIIHVSKHESDTSDVYKNDRIDDYNNMILDMVKSEGVYYVDVNEEFDDNGALKADAASDGIHLKASYCKEWLDFLKKHTVQ